MKYVPIMLQYAAMLVFDRLANASDIFETWRYPLLLMLEIVTNLINLENIITC